MHGSHLLHTLDGLFRTRSCGNIRVQTEGTNSAGGAA
jgi:hypothetical protein